MTNAERARHILNGLDIDYEYDIVNKKLNINLIPIINAIAAALDDAQRELLSELKKDRG